MHLSATTMLALLLAVTAATWLAASGSNDSAACGSTWPNSPTVVLGSGSEMPRVGLGTAALGGERTRRAVRAALDAGIRMFDGAEATEWYDDRSLGAELRLAVDEGRVARNELFITTKLHPKNLGTVSTRKAIEEMLVNLQTDYLDLVLIHFPVCGHWINTCTDVQVEGTWRDSWRVMEAFVQQGKLRAIGLSNFDQAELQQAIAFATHKPDVVQNWMDPFHQDKAVRALCAAEGIVYTSYSTLGGQWEHRGERRNLVKESSTIREVANRHKLHWSSVALRWALQRGAVVIPRSASPSHIADNAGLLGPGAVALTEAELAAIDALLQE
mmetsp:Transcript_8655/g.24710  ORF Transcript_8655/g.24710 Transcript_8655/m.24710 type:complete len:328 (-) Transcript_8655:945-1928(-)